MHTCIWVCIPVCKLSLICTLVVVPFLLLSSAACEYPAGIMMQHLLGVSECFFCLCCILPVCCLSCPGCRDDAGE